MTQWVLGIFGVPRNPCCLEQEGTSPSPTNVVVAAVFAVVVVVAAVVVAVVVVVVVSVV